MLRKLSVKKYGEKRYKIIIILALSVSFVFQKQKRHKQHLNHKKKKQNKKHGVKKLFPSTEKKSEK
jgi:hypothetical protein